MINYFFFISERRTNEQGEWRTVLHALPNQTTYDLHARGPVPVRTDLRVQADSASLGLIVRKPIGTVWGIAVSGNTPHRASLKVYTRNNENFYRADGCLPEYMFGEEMREAYNSVIGRHEPELPLSDTTTEDSTVAPPSRGPVIHQLLAAGRDFVRALKNSREELMFDTMMDLSRLNDLLALGTVMFTYEKNSDGSIREAVGTRCPGVIRRILTENGQSRATAGEVANDIRSSAPFDGEHVIYFDLERRDWRCFTVDKFQEVDLDSFVPHDMVNAA